MFPPITSNFKISVTRTFCLVMCCTLALICPAQANLSEKQSQCIKLNNEGVLAINNKDWKLAQQKLAAALELDPGYALAKDNLTVMHGQHALQLRQEHKFDDALKEFHQAAYASDYWNEALCATIEKCGKNPKSFVDRVALAEAERNNDYIGSAVEYRAALELTNDREVHKKLADAYSKLGEKNKADVENALANEAPTRDSPAPTAP